MLQILFEFVEVMVTLEDNVALRIEEEEMRDAGEGELRAEDAVEVEDLVVVDAQFGHRGERILWFVLDCYA